MATKEKKKRRPRQAVIPGAEDQFVPELTEAVLNYVDARDRRMVLTQEETETQDALRQAMKRHKLTRYKTPEGLLAVFVHSEAEKVRVVKPKDVEINGEAE